MEITLNHTDLLLLAQQAGIIAGIADSLSNNGIMPDKRTKALHDASELIIGMVRTKVNDSINIDPEKVIKSDPAYFPLNS